MKPYRASATQVSTFELCPRKWAFLKLDKIEVEPNRFAAFGTEVHECLARWFAERVAPGSTPEAKVARAILQHLPPPQTPGIEVEQEIRTMLGGVEFVGYVDLRIFDGLDVPFVSDHKTTGDLRWAKEPDDLPDDVQATLYAYDAMCATNKRACDLQWTYGVRSGGKSLPVRRRVTLEEIKPRLDKTAATVAVMRQIFEHKPPAIEVPCDAGGCEAFGGCPFQGICKLSPQERIRSIMSQEQHSAFLAKLRSKRAPETNAKPHPAPAEAAPEPVDPVPTTAGTVNPPEAPATAEPAPPPEVPEAPKSKPKGRRKRRTKAQIAADKAAQAGAEAGNPANVDTTALDDAVKAAQSPATAPEAPRAPEPAPSPPAPVAGPVAPVAGDLLGLLNRQYAEGFKAGVAMALGMGLRKP